MGDMGRYGRYRDAPRLQRTVRRAEPAAAAAPPAAAAGSAAAAAAAAARQWRWSAAQGDTP